MGKENRNASHGENNDKCCLSYNVIYNQTSIMGNRL